MTRAVRKAYNEAAAKPNAKRKGKGKQEHKRYPSPVTLRLKHDERTLLKERSGDLSLSAYIRLCLFGDDIPIHRTRGKEPVKDYKALAELLGMLGRSSLPNNINQLTKAAHQGDVVLSDDAETDLKTAALEIAAMRLLLIRALGLMDGGK